MVYTLRTNTTSSFLNTDSVKEENHISPKTQKSVNLKDTHWEYIAKQSDELEISQNELLRRILDLFIEENGLKNKEQATRRLTK